jgi:microcystin-dependent protein
MEGVIGYITAFAGNFAPRNWMLCQGQLIAISSNPALFSILGVNYGGNGSTTFALPDLRGRAVIGVGAGPGLTDYQIGEQQGNETTILTLNEIPIHTHPAQITVTPAAATAANSNSPVNGVYAKGTEQLYNGSTDSSMQTYAGTLATQVTGSGTGFPSMHPVLTLNYIICAFGVFPSRN